MTETVEILRSGWLPPVPESLPDYISRHLQSEIMSGRITAGTRLRQEELCEAFGVSRTPVREALRQLQAEGLIDFVANRGATVKAIQRSDVVELYQVRAELEGLAGSLAADRISDSALKELEDCIQSASTAAKAKDRQRDAATRANEVLRQASHTFHRVIYEQAGNRFLCETLTRLFRSFPRDYVWSMLRASGRTERVDVVDHTDILAALASHDAPLTQRLMRQHTLEAGRKQIEYLDETEFWHAGDSTDGAPGRTP
jgi:DNA-binding GntR family transcriptional regulator